MGLFIVFVAPGLFDTTMDTLILKQSKDTTALNAGHLSRFYDRLTHLRRYVDRGWRIRRTFIPGAVADV